LQVPLVGLSFEFNEWRGSSSSPFFSSAVAPSVFEVKVSLAKSLLQVVHRLHREQIIRAKLFLGCNAKRMQCSLLSCIHLFFGGYVTRTPPGHMNVSEA